MKHNYTDTQLQAAIDEACIEIRREHRGKVGTSLVIDTAAMPSTYKAEASARLDLIKAALAALPEQCETQRISLEQLFQKPNAIADELQLSQLRSVAEAGPVPEGCVRYHFSKYGDDIGVGTIAKHPSDVLFADIRLPEPSEKPAPTPLVTEPISLPEWTPKVGDVVTLKSGGPKMTVMQDIGHNFLCAYDSLGEVKTVSIPTNCLQPA